ncbi:hypothetical protein [Pseudomonas sp. R5(2019)]|uniref:hypothetical protein n=1 Tax=Pseudomonas sp. R5(2019) TaxID=2697566 RepID=UPI0014126C1B|nr:hypothetical protein [Pseudomonas sp. R5(2019)]NBA94781.1 hypothetical protein [Pseudomonas sp. R5(2019)]
MATTVPLPNPGSLDAASTQRLALDNLIRRELKVGDPNDPNQVAQALLNRYKGDPRAEAIAQEARGMPFLQTVAPLSTVSFSATASNAEWEQACNDIEQDLRHLTTDTLLKDVTPELQGWAQAIRSTLQEGQSASRLALDPRNRDKGFAMRRQLNDYARLARLVGVHTPSMVTDYRKLAQSLDEAANLLLVMMGEALANVGFGGGRYLPQVAYSDLQTRRDAAIYALRNLVGSTQMAYGPQDWPRGLDAYRQLNDLLEAQGQSDLRSLLVETELARIMDELVQRSGDNTSGGLRAVGSTAVLSLERFRRLITVAQRGISPESPALYGFLEALQLFASAFDSSGGFRLMKIARPPILFYGLYGNTGMNDADQRLVSLTLIRGMLADELDCLAQNCLGNCSDVVLLDRVLYGVDRAIDLYALGFVNFGAAERRASAYGFLVKAVVAAMPIAAPSLMDSLIKALQPSIDWGEDESMGAAVHGLIQLANRELDALNAIDRTAGDEQLRAELAAAIEKFENQGAGTIEDFAKLYTVVLRVDRRLVALGISVRGDADVDAYIAVVVQELVLQGELDDRWSSLVHSMVTNCSTIDQSLGSLRTVMMKAMKSITGEERRDRDSISLPPTLETSADAFIDFVDRTGAGRPNLAGRAQNPR